MDALLSALHLTLGMDTFLAVILGSLVGLFFGSIPGLTYSVALVLVLPATFTMEPTAGIALLLATYVGGMTGGSVSAILIGIPGTPSAAATVLDGYKLAQKGRACATLGMAVIVSTFGGLFSLVIMMVFVDLVAKLAIEFGPAEIFALVLFGFSTICGLAGKSLTRGLIAGVLGLLLMVIGMDDIEGIPRMTFGSANLMQGISLLVAMIGLFAVPQIIESFLLHGQGCPMKTGDYCIRMELPKGREIISKLWLMTRCSAIGTGIGAIPGAGGPIAAFLAYAHARKCSKNPEGFGEGDIDGVVAPESANNAVTGGAMIPLLSLGIPGDPATAILLAGMMIHGLTPGPMLFIEHLDGIYSIYIAIVLSYLAVMAFQLFGVRLFVRVLAIPPHLLSVAIIIMCAIGAFAIRSSIMDLYVMAIMGLIGYILQRVRIPVTPIVLGMVLGKALEGQFRMALIMTSGDPSIFFSSWIALLFLGLTLSVVVLQVIKVFKGRKGKKNTKEKHSDSGILLSEEQ